jgi:hypothetical protein
VEAGVKLGRRSRLSAYQQAEVIKRRAEGENLTVSAKAYGVAHPTTIRALRRHEAARTGTKTGIWRVAAKLAYLDG